jgi:glycerol-3-phosphate acyltransferase PlsY
MRWTAAAGVAAIVGHSFPVFIRFRGGKSVATGLGVFLFLTPLAVAACLGVWLSALAIWRYVSLSSMLATAAYPVLAYALYHPTLPVLLAGAVGACIIVLRHHANIRQLMAGTENKFALRRKS